MTEMKKLLIIAAIALLASAAGQAQQVDFETYKCADYNQQDADFGAMLWYWMDGQIHGEAGDTSFDKSQIKDLVNGLAQACSERPDEPVLSVYEDLSR